MDAEQLAKLLEKANENYEQLKQSHDDLLAKVNDGDTSLAALEENYKTQIEALKNEIADIELKAGQPNIQTGDQETHDKTLIQKAIGAAIKSAENNKDILDIDIKALNLTNTGEGMESVADILSGEVIERARESYPIVGLVRTRDMPRDFTETVLVSFPSVQEGIENVAGAPISETENQKYVTIKNKICKISAKPRITDEARMGSDLGLYDQLLRLLDDEFGRKLATQILFGDGAGKNMRGILTSNRLDVGAGGQSFKPTFDATDPRDPDFYCAVGSGEASTMPSTDEALIDWLLDIVTKTPSAYLQGANWTFNRHTLNRIMKVKDTQGRPIFMESYMGNGVRVLGYPVVLEDYMPSEAADAPVIIFGQLDKAYEISKGDVVKMLVDPYTVDGNTVIKSDVEWYEKAAKNDAITIGVCTTNS